MTQETKQEVERFLRDGDKPGAIKHLRETYGFSLAQSKILVEAMEEKLYLISDKPWLKQDTVPDESAKARLTGLLAGGRKIEPGRIFLLIFGAVGVLFLSVAGYIFYSQNQSIGKSDLVTGQVIRMKTNGDGMAAPVFEYEFDGRKWLHASSTYSSPPAYEVNEEVPIYVNREDPADITVDTFSDRWFLISIFGFMGLVFTGIPVLVASLVRRR